MGTSLPESDRSANESTPSPAEDIGRRAAAFAKAAGPRVSRLVEETKPRIQKAGRDVVEYARAHEGELKDTASKLARARLRGPLGLVFDGLASGGGNKRVVCPSCQSANPRGARYCNQCGSRLEGEGNASGETAAV